jgi:phenylalanyl-tRNA synthetase beta chain
MDLMNVIEPLMNYLNLSFQFVPKNEKFPNPLVSGDWPGIHPNEYLDIKVMGKNCGFINSLHPVIGRKLKIKGNLAIAMLDITDFMDRVMKDKTTYNPLPKFPGSDFDCTVVAGSQVPVSEILLVLKRLKVKQLESVKVVDVFTMNDDEKAVTLRTRFQDKEKTLTPEVIKEAEEKVVATLAAGGYPLKM